jgi:signal transduction histidine kinase
MTILVNITGGFDSSFFNGFYLMTALYSFYYGPLQGIVVAAIAALLYLVSGNFDFTKLYWTDFSLRVAFLFLLAVPLGMLSQKLKTGKDKIEHLNKELQEYIEGLRDIQGKLVQAEKLSAIGRLTADVAHEIRNPLTSIGGFARRLDKKLIPGSKEKEYAELIIFEVNRLERILRDVLAFSREPKANMEPQGINEVVKESIKTFSDICNEQSIRIEENLNGSLPPVLIDRDQIREAITNLISNAVDAMPTGGVLKVRTFMERMYEVNYVVVEVADTGSGISEEELNMIFEPFYTTKRIGSGTGLGLSICKKIVDEHNGLIRVISEPGKGATFRLFFPYQSEEESAGIKCWEFHRCGVERAEGAAEMRCRAYPHFGRICWAVAGTFCEKKVSGAIAQKLGDCRKCEFYQRVAIRKNL